VLREFAQPFHVFLDKLGGPVVVVEDGEDPVDDGVVGLSDSDVEGEKGVYDRVDEEVELCFEEGPDWLGFAVWCIAS